MGLVVDPIYLTLSLSLLSVCVRVRTATISSILCDVPEKARLVLECVSGREHSVRTIILMEPFDDELVAKGKDCGIDILSLSQVEVRGETLTYNWAVCFTTFVTKLASNSQSFCFCVLNRRL